MSPLPDTSDFNALSRVRSPVVAPAQVAWIEVTAHSPGFGNTPRTCRSEESFVSLRIAGVLGVVNRFVARSSRSGKSRDKRKHPLSVERDWTSSDPPTKFAPTDDCDGLFSIRGQLLQDEWIELEKLFDEIDQFSQTFKNADRQRCNV